MNIVRAMYFDDDADSCEVMKILLISNIPGLVVECVMPGKDAIRMANERPFDVYILDAKVAGIDGFDVCHNLRQRDPQVPIYFYTGLASKADRDSAFEAGCTDFLIKPNDMDNLIERVADVVRKTGGQTVISAPAG